MSPPGVRLPVDFRFVEKKVPFPFGEGVHQPFGVEQGYSLVRSAHGDGLQLLAARYGSRTGLPGTVVPVCLYHGPREFRLSRRADARHADVPLVPQRQLEAAFRFSRVQAPQVPGGLPVDEDSLVTLSSTLLSSIQR